MPVRSEVNVTIEGRTTVLEPCGRLDGPTTRVLCRLVAIATEAGAGVVVDLRRVERSTRGAPSTAPHPGGREGPPSPPGAA